MPLLSREDPSYPQAFCALMFPELALLRGSAMSDYELYAFTPDAIGNAGSADAGD